MNLRQIEVFRSVMVTGSVTGASKLLNVTPPGVSRTIKHLQLSLGVPLFEHCRGRLVPTEEARCLYAEIERAYHGIESVQYMARTLKTGGGSRLRVLACPGTSLRTVPDTIGRAHRAQPSLQIQFHVMTGNCIRDALVSQQADIGVCIEDIDHPNLQTEAIAELRLVAALATDHRLASRQQISLAEIVDDELILFDPNTSEGRAIQRLFEIQDLEPHHCVEVQTGRSACSLVEAGVGVALVDELTANSILHRNVVIIPVDLKPMFTVCWVRNRSVPLSGPVRSFLELLGKEFAATLGRSRRR